MAGGGGGGAGGGNQMGQQLKPVQVEMVVQEFLTTLAALQ
jgi:hypothetical protein